MNEELEMSCFQIITYVGTGRSCFVNVIQSAKAGNSEEGVGMIVICVKSYSGCKNLRPLCFFTVPF